MNKLLISLFILTICFSKALGQSIPANLQDYSVSHYTNENGLPQNSIKSIYKSKIGFIWLLTENGILRYGGKQFSPIIDSTNLSTGNRYFSLHVVNSNQEEKIYSQSENTKFQRVHYNYSITDSLIERDLPEKFRIDNFRKVYRTSGNPNPFNQFPDLKTLVISISEEENDHFIIDSTSITLYSINKKVYSIPHSSDSFWKMFRIDKSIYLQNDDNTFKRFNNKGAINIKINGDITNNPDFNSNRKLVVFWNNNNNQIFFSLNDVLYHAEAEPNGDLNTTLLLSGFNITKQYINQIYYDKSKQQLFLGSLINGLYILQKKRFLNLRIGDDENENVYYGQIAYDSNSILTTQGIILGYDPATQKHFSRVLPDFVNRSTSDRYVIFRDKKKNIWFKEGKSFLVYDSLGYKHLSTVQLEAEINIIHQEDSGKVWIGSTKGELFSFIPEEKPIKFTNWTSKINGNIMVIKNLGPDSLLIGSTKGLYRYVISKKKLEAYNYFKDIYIKNLYAPNPQEIWINTYGKGSYLIYNKKIIEFPNDKNGHLLTTHCIFEDRTGFMWATTNKGLFRFAKNDLINFAKSGDVENIWYSYFSKADGFGTNEFNGGCQPCAIRLPNDYVSFPSFNGLVWFKPENIEGEKLQSSIFLDKVVVNKGYYTIKKDSINFSEAQIQAIIHLSTPYFGNIYSLRLEYNISSKKDKSQNRKWTTIDSENPVIYLPQLSAGEYDLMVRKYSGNGINNFFYKPFNLHVPAPWYESNWIYSILGVLCLLSLYLLADLRSKYLQRKNLNLEKLVRKRTHELNTTLEELRHSQADLTWQSFINGQIIASISHDVKTPLKYLTSLTNTLYESIKETKDPDMIEISKASHDTSKRLYYLISNLMQYIKGNNQPDGFIHKEEVDFHKLVDLKIQLFEDSHTLNPTTVQNLIPEDFKICSSPQLLEIIVQNLIDNAIKASPNGGVKVEVSESTSQKDVILFFNPGTFLSKDLLNWFNEYKPVEKTNSRHNQLPKHTGLGLIIIKQLAGLLEIDIIASSSEKSGTEIYLTFPKSKEIV